MARAIRRRVWGALAAAGLMGAATQASAQTNAPAQPPSPPAPASATAPSPFQEIFITMRDGTKLAANVYLPKGKGPWPVVVMRTPYIKDNGFWGAGAGLFTDAGYVYVIQDVRGKGHSQGHYDAFFNDTEDGYDTVEALAAEPWSNGQIGMTGASAMGITATEAAIAAPPHLKAAYVVVTPSERFTTSFLGGVLKEKDTVGWMKGQGESDEAIAAAEAGAIRSAFTERQVGANLKYVRIPIYSVGGWYDIFNTGTIANFEYLQNHGAKGARGNQKLRMGPFGHGPLSGGLAYPGEDSLSLQSADEIRWFDYWLKGVDNGIMDEPPVDAFMMASAERGAYSPKNRHIKAADWPIDYREVRYYLTPDLGLASKAPTIESAKLSYRFDPAHPVPTVGGANLTFERGPMDQRPIQGRADYLRFQTPVLDHDVAIAGPVKVELFGATDGPDTDFEAKLVDVYPDGYEALVLDAPIRARYRHGRMPDDVEMMTPNAPEELDIDLWNTAITFEKGHRIALHVTSSNSPRFEVNDNNGEAPGERLPPRVATNTIYLDRDHPSALVLPVVYLDAR
jgi:predicted acyl esterase